MSAGLKTATTMSNIAKCVSAPLKPAKCTNACGEPYLYRETTVADWQTGPLLQGNFISPQPHSNLCPACNINGGGTGGGSAAGGTGSVRLAIDEAYVQLTPGNVTIIRSGAGTSVIVGLGDVFDGLDPSEPLTVLSTALVDDPSLELEDATVVVEFTDPASGLTFNAYDSITVTVPAQGCIVQDLGQSCGTQLHTCFISTMPACSG